MMFGIVKNMAIDVPQIYEIYSYVIYVFLENKIINVLDLEEIINEKDVKEDDIKIVSNIFKKTYQLYNKEDFKKIIDNFSFVKNNSKLFQWLDEEKKDDEN